MRYEPQEEAGTSTWALTAKDLPKEVLEGWS